MNLKKLRPAFFSIALGAFVGVSSVVVGAKTVKAEEEIIIKPFAEYKFQDAENLGKDTSGNGFDLVKAVTSAKPEAIQQLEDANGKYLSIKHDTYGNGTLKDTGGAWLYAPELGNTNKDFSDLIDGNYTISATIKADYAASEGNHYAITLGRYCSAIQLTPWRNGVEVACGNSDFYDPTSGVEKQNWLQSNQTVVPVPAEKNNDWVTITITGDTENGKIKLFLDGNLVSEVVAPNGQTRLSNVKADEEASSYAFCIGGQCDVRGGSVDPMIGAVCDYREVTVYDCKLSDENVKAICSGDKAVISNQEEGNNVYVTNVADIDTSSLDLEITDKNTINSVVKEQLGSKKLKVTTSDGNAMSYKTVWYPAADGKTIKGKVMVPGAINCENVQAEIEYKYVCKLDVDTSKVDVSEVKLDGKAYNFGDEITSARHTVSFILTPKAGVTLETVEFNDMEWEPEEDEEVAEGSFLYIIQFTKGAQISVVASGGNSSEGGGSEGSGSETGKKGCKGSVIASSGVLAVLALTGTILVLAKKKED